MVEFNYENFLKKIWGNRLIGILTSLGVGVSVAVFGIGDDNPVDDADKGLQHPVDTQAPDEVQQQIDENKQRLNTLEETDTEKQADYTLLGC